ncbi:GTPase-associated system all-helical protein GASH [Paraburkholderia sabiae]|uniref:GTPase-associated system all-helical protein GASH n=1 Tax=Paraburkholderia sabiae TaxID=273251 RepID=A0ABU9QRG0_9BURK|nr:GTPase-associated system all-helical protein GASH [Paraburkholderia sabiae]WJZ79364.1 GTPase-associated system all-helical protein GASH [Paraburkholderia sabiae]CAD6563036.1 hypothetical protein LMG24235_08278 [Paraburkholderia sabiae]
MQSLFDDFVAAGLITKLDGDDTRLVKIVAAVNDLAVALKNDRQALLRAALAAINPDVRDNDPAIVSAHKILVEKWPTMRSVHTSMPLALLRAMLLDACNFAAEDARGAAIVWNTLVDQLPFARLGVEAPIVEKMLHGIAQRAEGESQIARGASAKKTAVPQPPEIPAIEVEVPEWDLGADVGAALHQFNSPHNQPTSRVDPTKLAGVMEKVAQELSTAVDASLKRTTDALTATAKYASDVSAHLSKTTRVEFERQTARDLVRLDCLWWYEAMYSPKCQKGYREMPLHAAAVVMVIDLLEIIVAPAPAATAYLLAEAVNRLDAAGFDRSYALKDLLAAIREAWAGAPLRLSDYMSDAPSAGELSIRDVFVAAINDRDCDVESILSRAGVSADWSGSLPAFARALYRQEQAERLARDAG